MNEQLSNQFIWLSTAFISALMIVVFALNWQYLAGVELLMDSADALYPEHYARDILSGVSIWDWQNTQAPYFFPDIFIQFILVLVGAPKKIATAFYLLASALLLFASWGFVATRLFQQRWQSIIALSFIAFVSLLSLTGDHASSSWFHTLIYVHLCGHHGGYALSLPVAVWLTVRLLTKPDLKSAAALFLLSACMMLSDMLYGFAFVAPTTCWILHHWHKKRLTTQQLKQWLMLIIGAFLASRIFGFLTPYPSDVGFLKGVAKSWPDSVIPGLQIFASHLQHYYLNPNGSSGLMGWIFVLCFIFLVRWLIKRPQPQTATAHDMLAQLLAVIAVIGFVCVITPQLGLGIYEYIPHSRHFAAFFAILPITAFLLWLRERHLPHFIRAESLSIAALLVVAIVFPLTMYAGRQASPFTSSLSKLTACYTALAKEHQINGILTDYWMVRPMIFAGDDSISFTSVSDTDMRPAVNILNVTRSKMVPPNGVLVWNALSTEKTLHYFGKPNQIYSCASTPELAAINGAFALYDYRGNTRLAAWRNQGDTIEVSSETVTLAAREFFRDADFSAIQEDHLQLAAGTKANGRRRLKMAPGEYLLRTSFSNAAQGDFSCSMNRKTLQPSGALNGASVIEQKVSIPRLSLRQRQMLQCDVQASTPIRIEKFEIIPQPAK